MKLIKEHIKFERGLNPKVAMQLGRWKVWSNMERILLQAKRPFIIKNFYLEDADKAEPNDFVVIKDAAVVVRESFYSKSDHLIKLDCVIFEGTGDPRFVMIYSIPEKLDYYFQIISDSVKESYNFERGLDPKHAMGIGVNPVEIALDKFIRSDKNEQNCIEDYGTFLDDTMFWIYMDMYEKGKSRYISRLWKDAGLEKYFTFHKQKVSNKVREFEWLIKPEYKHLYNINVINNIGNEEEIDEGYHFNRGLDPKRAMNVGIDAWKNLDAGWSLKLLNDLPNIGFKKGMIVQIMYFILDSRPLGRIRFKYALYNNEEDFKHNIIHIHNDWEISKEFFEENFSVIPPKQTNESYHFERGLDPKASMTIGQAAYDQQILDAIKKLPIDAEWVKYFPKTKTGNRYIKIVFPSYWLMKKSASKELVDMIKKANSQHIQSVSMNKDDDVVIKLKK